MTREEIIDVLGDDKMLDYMQRWQLEYIVNFVIENYNEDK